jgi:phosphoglycolate phosphatase
MAGLTAPDVLLFDWHGTLVDTLDAMYEALDDLLPRLAAKGLFERFYDHARIRTPRDARLIAYVQTHRELPPAIKAERRVSRTEIFEILFGTDESAKAAAHALYDECYRAHYGSVRPFAPDVPRCLTELKNDGRALGIVTNRNREFLEHELSRVDAGRWTDLFTAQICGDDVQRRKPDPEGILRALERIGVAPGKACWYVGDSITDIAAAERAGIGGIYYNSGQDAPTIIARIFPGTHEHPEQPDAIVDNFESLLRLARAMPAPNR